MGDSALIKQQLLRDDIAYITRSLSRASYNKYGNYAYSAAFFESLTVDVIASLLPSDRNAWLRMIQNTINDLTKE